MTPSPAPSSLWAYTRVVAGRLFLMAGAERPGMPIVPKILEILFHGGARAYNSRARPASHELMRSARDVVKERRWAKSMEGDLIGEISRI
jgi:hypothetical protein